MKRRIRIGCIGYGRMGRDYVSAMLAVPELWDVVYICDINPAALAEAKQRVRAVKLVADPDIVLTDRSLDAVGLFTLADDRPAQLCKALRAGLHVLAEKPLAADVETEWKLLEDIEASDRIVAINTFNRNAWYHHEMLAFIADGEIGDLAILRLCHMTPGHMPTEGHDPEGPPFHDCGMHYVDVARWYARSEYARWHAQGLRMWGHKDPWWVQVHGCFENGVVFDITQGFVYGHLAKDQTQNCYMDVIGSRGIARMHHNFKEVVLECHGVTRTVHKSGPYTNKNLDRLCDLFARSVLARRDLGCPRACDVVVASSVAWAMLRDAIRERPPSIGSAEEMRKILENRARMPRGAGYGLPVRPVQTGRFAAAQLARVGSLNAVIEGGTLLASHAPG